MPPVLPRLEALLQSGPLIISGLYLIFGILWIHFSDNFAYLIAGGDQDRFLVISSFKGFGFIIITAIFLFILIQYYFRKLAEEHERYHAIFNQTFQITGLLSPVGEVIDVNNTSLVFTGVTEAEVKGKPFWETAFWRHSKEIQGKIQEAIYNASMGKFVRFETTCSNFNGEIRNIDFSIKPLKNESGSVVMLISEGRDITDRKKAESNLLTAYEQIAASEEKLRQNYENLEKSEKKIRESEQRLYDIINFIPDATFAIDENGIVIAWNRAIEDMTGIQAATILGKNDHEYSIPFYGDRRPILIDMIFDEIEVILSQYETVKREGNWLIAETFVPGTYLGKGAHLWAIASPLYDTNGVIVGAIESIRDTSDKKMAVNALAQSRKKLNLLNTVTLQDIQNAVFSLTAYIELEGALVKDGVSKDYIETEKKIAGNILNSLKFAQYYQNLGLNPPRWQNVQQVFLFGISHTDLSNLTRNINLEDLEIYGDPLLENVFFTLAENVILHGKTATEIRLWFYHSDNDIVIVFEDNGCGISKDMKENIFDRQYEEKKGIGLFLSREILSITNILIRETGEEGQGARFELTVPKGMYRFSTDHQ